MHNMYVFVARLLCIENPKKINDKQQKAQNWPVAATKPPTIPLVKFPHHANLI